MAQRHRSRKTKGMALVSTWSTMFVVYGSLNDHTMWATQIYHSTKGLFQEQQLLKTKQRKRKSSSSLSHPHAMSYCLDNAQAKLMRWRLISSKLVDNLKYYQWEMKTSVDTKLRSTSYPVPFLLCSYLEQRNLITNIFHIYRFLLYLVVASVLVDRGSTLMLLRKWLVSKRIPALFSSCGDITQRGCFTHHWETPGNNIDLWIDCHTGNLQNCTTGRNNPIQT